MSHTNDPQVEVAIGILAKRYPSVFPHRDYRTGSVKPPLRHVSRPRHTVPARPSPCAPVRWVGILCFASALVLLTVGLTRFVPEEEKRRSYTLHTCLVTSLGIERGDAADVSMDFVDKYVSKGRVPGPMDVCPAPTRDQYIQYYHSIPKCLLTPFPPHPHIPTSQGRRMLQLPRHPMVDR